MSTIATGGPAPEPFDEDEYLRLLDHFEEARGRGIAVGGPTLGRFLRLCRQAATETITLRTREREAQQRVTLLEAGQQLLPLTTANQPTPSHAQA
jgi:hypothetical protein